MYSRLSLRDNRKDVVPARVSNTVLGGIGQVQPSVLEQFVVQLSPRDASLLLKNVHPGQRKLNLRRVRKLLRAMQRGQWHEPPFTFDSIAFDSSGRLCNGLHRLTALSQFNRPLSFIAIVGVEPPADMPLPDGDQPLPRADSFVSGIERGHWSVINYLSEHVYSEPTRTEVSALYGLFADALDAFPRLTNRPPPAPVRAAFVFCWTESQDAVFRQELASQWEAYCKLDVTKMWPGIGRLYRKMQQTNTKGIAARHTCFAYTMYAIRNPEAMRISEQNDAGKRVKEFAREKLFAGE